MLADAEGRVIGVNTMIFQGLGLAIPSNDVAAFVKGEANRARLGIEMIPTREGLVVVNVERQSRAERSGIMIGDILRCAPRDLLTLTNLPILRGGKEIRVRLSMDSPNEARAA
jgi:serine protease Do